MSTDLPLDAERPRRAALESGSGADAVGCRLQCVVRRWLHKRLRSESPVDGQASASNEARVGACKMSNQRRDLIRSAVAGQGHQTPELVGRVAVCGVHVRVDWSRLHVVDRDAAWTQVADQALDQPNKCRLA